MMSDKIHVLCYGDSNTWGSVGRYHKSTMPSEKGCYFLNAAAYAHPGEADGIHFDAESHVYLGTAVAEYIKKEIYPGR